MNKVSIILSLSSALCLAISDALIKKAFSQVNEYDGAWLRLIFCLPLLLASLLFIDVPVLDRKFFISFGIALPLEILAMVLYIKALRISPLSLTLPFLSLTPLFLIIFSYLVLRESLSLRGVLGILCISAGGYMLNIHAAKKSFLEPLRAIMKERGSVYMIGVACIYSFTSALGKIGIVHSSPLFFGVTYFLVLTLAFTPLKKRFGRENILATLNGKTMMTLAFSGIAYAGMIVSHMLAISMSKAAYMIALKRSSILIGVVLGYVFFQESRVGQRFLGALIMFAGIVLIVLSQQ